MSSKAQDYRPMIGYEDLYEVNRLHTVRPFNREIMCRGIAVSLRQNPPVIKKIGNVIYAIIRDKDFKNRKVNITLMVKNLFGRQRPIKVGRPREQIHVVKPINRNGRNGISVEQYEDGKMIGVFPTFAAAAKAIGGESRYVSDAAYGKRSMYGGYKWQFKK
jgi:hypothetical protein